MHKLNWAKTTKLAKTAKWYNGFKRPNCLYSNEIGETHKLAVYFYQVSGLRSVTLVFAYFRRILPEDISFWLSLPKYTVLNFVAPKTCLQLFKTKVGLSSCHPRLREKVSSTQTTIKNIRRSELLVLLGFISGKVRAHHDAWVPWKLSRSTKLGTSS